MPKPSFRRRLLSVARWGVPWRRGGAIAGSLAGARVHAQTRATLDSTGPPFVGFLLGVIVIVGGLIYLPMLILGPIGERIIG